ncbi:MAG: aminoacyl-tRNA hydrolase [Thermodesulfobacteriota bacterium]
MLLIVGLGNPGRGYEDTRHNVGFMLVDRLADAHKIVCDKPGWKSYWGSGVIADEEVVLLKPCTYMNLSGDAVVRLTSVLSAPAESVVVAYDDCDLPLGQVRIRAGGGSGGHKGVESITAALNSSSFLRIRLGIGRPDEGELSDYVLAPFDVDEHDRLDGMLSRGAASIEVIIKEGIGSAMNKFNSFD